VRVFESGATRDGDDSKLDFEGFISPLVIQRYAEYMHAHRIQSDGQLRASDNWSNGMPLDSYMKSGFRHFMDWWMEHRGHASRESLEDALCGLLFNVMGYLHETIGATGNPPWSERIFKDFERIGSEDQDEFADALESYTTNRSDMLEAAARGESWDLRTRVLAEAEHRKKVEDMEDTAYAAFVDPVNGEPLCKEFGGVTPERYQQLKESSLA